MFLLDTNVCIAFLNAREPALTSRLRRAGPAHVKLCSVVKAELLYGARASARVDSNLGNLERFFAAFESLPFDDRAADHYGLLRALLRREGRPIGGNDMLIAATALAHDATLVTRDTEELSRVPGLRLDAW